LVENECLVFKYMFKHFTLTLTKTITIRDEVYKKLAAVKRRDESFSELFERLVRGTNSVEVLGRLKGSMEFKNKEKTLSEIQALRAERRL